MKNRIDLLVLDAHGVVLNNPLRAFLRRLAEDTGQSPSVVLERWDRELRLPAWTGALDEDELWSLLTGAPAGQGTTRRWRAALEARYGFGPAAASLERWCQEVPVALLSNHRSEWLRPRLERFGLAERFQHVWISDRLGAAKPSSQAYRPILEAGYAPERVLFVDDKERNVRAAREQGLLALQLTPGPAALRTIERCIASTTPIDSLTPNPR